MRRDASGNFAANTVTADLVGDVTGNVSGTAANVTGIVAGANGGTGVNNGTNTITIGGNVSTQGAFTQSGAFATTLTSTAATNVTLPTTGTLATRAGTETLTNKTIGSGGLTFDDPSNDVTLQLASQTTSAASLTIPDLQGNDAVILTADASVGAGPVAFEAYYSANGRRITFTPNNQIEFDAENFDTSNSYSTSTYEFTAPTDGLYHFQVQIMMEDGDDREFELVLRVDADGTGGGLPSIVARNAQRALDGTDTDTSYQINKMVQLTQGAIVDIRLLQVVVGAGIIDQDLFGSQANSYFSGYLVR